MKGDITALEVDVIVNAANSYLEHGGGVALAISEKGGPRIQRESTEYVRKHGPVPAGSVAVTSAGRLRAKYVVHAVGPIYGVEGDDKLESAVRNSILKAMELGAKSVALPAISTGAYGYPYERCALLTARVLREFREAGLRIVVCIYTDEGFEVFSRIFRKELGSP
ncbi:macro domain-containing protein [Sulfodiicoccus acidiphilus]|nr:macro domain-containing protein [Sulfodiicoccus acidiphilus]